MFLVSSLLFCCIPTRFFFSISFFSAEVAGSAPVDTGAKHNFPVIFVVAIADPSGQGYRNPLVHAVKCGLCV